MRGRTAGHFCARFLCGDRDGCGAGVDVVGVGVGELRRVDVTAVCDDGDGSVLVGADGFAGIAVCSADGDHVGGQLRLLRGFDFAFFIVGHASRRAQQDERDERNDQNSLKLHISPYHIARRQGARKRIYNIIIQYLRAHVNIGVSAARDRGFSCPFARNML